MSNSEYSNRRRAQSSAARRSTRVSRYEDPYTDYDDYYPDARETRRSSSRASGNSHSGELSSRENIEDYRDHSRYTSRGSSNRSSSGSANRSRTDTRRASYGDRPQTSRTSRDSQSRERISHTSSSNRRQRAASMQRSSERSSQSKRPLVICIIILLILDIALAIGIYAYGASLDKKAAAKAAQSAPQASQAAYVISGVDELLET